VKYLILSLFAFVCFNLSAQVQYREGYAIDTFVNSTVEYIYPNDAASAGAAVDFKELGTLEVVIVTDSLSGSTAGTVTLQYCYDDACTYTYDAATLTVNGATQQVSRTEDTDFTPRKWRVKLAGSGTQTTKCQVYHTFKRKI
jgi:hypothetical protein